MVNKIHHAYDAGHEEGYAAGYRDGAIKTAKKAILPKDPPDEWIEMMAIELYGNYYYSGMSGVSKDHYQKVWAKTRYCNKQYFREKACAAYHALRDKIMAESDD